MPNNFFLILIAGFFVGFRFWKSTLVFFILIISIFLLEQKYDIPWMHVWTAFCLFLWISVIYALFLKARKIIIRIRKNGKK